MWNLLPGSKHTVHIDKTYVKSVFKWKIMWYLMGRFSLLSKSEKITSSSSPRLEHIRLFIWTKRWWLLAGTGVSFFRWRCSICKYHKQHSSQFELIVKISKQKEVKNVILNYFVYHNFQIFNLILTCNSLGFWVWFVFFFVSEKENTKKWLLHCCTASSLSLEEKQ